MNTDIMNSVRGLVLAVVASGVMLGVAAGPAAAAPVKETRIEVAKYDLTRPEGRKAVEGRVIAAASRLCSEGGVNQMSRAEVTEYKLCIADAVSSARAQINTIVGQQQLAAR
ncbi:MAG: hypothetical protein DI568_00550 [Sphingomonas sp.]|nr:MAG: hypothetical protein DI568_00550 [Sphingomonas sp.]